MSGKQKARLWKASAVKPKQGNPYIFTVKLNNLFHSP